LIRRWRRGVSERLEAALYSDRPAWAMMPGLVATEFAELAFFVSSLLERLGVEHVAHYGTLLGASRLGGFAPWDEDIDLYVVDTDLGKAEALLGPELAPRGFEMVARRAGDASYIRPRGWLAGQGHVGLSALPPLSLGDADPRSWGWDATLRANELRPIGRTRFYSSWLPTPALPEPILERLYASSGAAETMSRFRAPAIRPRVAEFWSLARPIHGETDWPAISARFERPRRARRAMTWPWWWFNGAYNVAVRKARAVGRALR
jgi:hypothetical protein